MVKDFIKQWQGGVKTYGSSAEGQLVMKRVFMIVVIIGLFGGSIQRLLDNDFWMFLVLGGFGFIMLIDYKNIVRQLESIRRL